MILEPFSFWLYRLEEVHTGYELYLVGVWSPY